jgi:ankyrin repeat protein
MIKKYLFIMVLSLFTTLHAEQNVPFIDEKDGFGRTAVHYSAWAGNERNLQTLLYYGASINAQDDQGNTPLNFLCSRKDFNNLSLIALMVKSGANIELEDNNGLRPLHKAILYSNAGVVSKLIECGASLDPMKDNTTVLHLAAQGNVDHSIIEVLLKAYAAQAKN